MSDEKSPNVRRGAFHSRARDPAHAPMAPFANFVTRELTGHRRRVHSVAWNCTGRKLASGSVD